VARENLIALGSCIGKFTHSSKFILTVGALDVLAQHAKFKARVPYSSYFVRVRRPLCDVNKTFSLQTDAHLCECGVLLCG